jgi:hypothetical protein
MQQDRGIMGCEHLIHRGHGAGGGGLRTWHDHRATWGIEPITMNTHHKKSTSTERPDGTAPEWTDRWPDVSMHLRKTHQGLTDDDLAYTKGREKELYQRLGTRLGKSEREAQQLVEEAARNQVHNPQDRSMLKDQRDRTTGADQATRKDGPSAEGSARITNTEESERIINAPSSPYDPHKPRH